MTLLLVFSCEFCEISKNTFSNRTPPVAASVIWKIVKLIALQRNVLAEVTGSRVSDHYARSVYKGLFINSGSVDVGTIKNTSSKH